MFSFLGLLHFCAVRNQRPLESSRQLHNTGLQQTQQSQDPDQLQVNCKTIIAKINFCRFIIIEDSCFYNILYHLFWFRVNLVQLSLMLLSYLFFQYAEVDFSKLRKNIRPSQDNSTYAALNLPKP